MSPAVAPTEELSPKTVKKAVIRHYGLSYQDLEGKSRQKKIVQARQICIYLMRDLLGISYSAIGKEIGGRGSYDDFFVLFPRSQADRFRSSLGKRL